MITDHPPFGWRRDERLADHVPWGHIGWTGFRTMDDNGLKIYVYFMRHPDQFRFSTSKQELEDLRALVGNN